MGFKCPICFKDFEKDKNSMIKHAKNCCGGAAKSIIDFVIKTTKKDDNEKDIIEC